MALLVALVAAVLVVLGAFAWVLLSPLVRGGNDAGEADRRSRDVPSTVLFGRPVEHRLVRPGERRAAVVVPPVPTVTVRAPAVPRPPAAPPPPAAPAGQPPVADVLLLSGDTGLSDRQLAMLDASGCSARRAATASDVVGLLRVRIPDLLLVDAVAETQAVPLVAALRAWAATETLPVVLFAGSSDDEVCRSAAELGVTDVVVDAGSVPGLVERALPYWLAGVGVFSTPTR